MDEPRVVWSESFRVRAYEVDVWGRASAPTVCNWLQEVAGNHAAHLGWGIERLQAQGLTWVLSRLHLHLDRLPRWRDEVRVTTWPAGAQRLYALREFRLDDSDGGAVGVATTGWMVLNLASRRPVRPAEEVAAMAARAPARALADPFDKLPEPASVELERSLEVRSLDLDINRHANNVSVIGWALEALPLEDLDGRRLAGLEIEFRGETRAGDRVVTQAQRSGDGTFVHRLLRAGDGREVARARTAWAPDGR